MKLEKIGLPKSAGIYFVTSDNKKYWEGIVRVSGQYPFFSVYVMSRTSKTTDLPTKDNEELISPADYIYSECIDIKID
jgi:hypothetical protein